LLGGRLELSDGTFLGDVLPAEGSIDSICNHSGAYGSPFSATSIQNRSGPHGSPFDGDQSAFNPAASDPPIVVVHGVPAARLTASPLLTHAIHPDALLVFLGCGGGY